MFNIMNLIPNSEKIEPPAPHVLWIKSYHLARISENPFHMFTKKTRAMWSGFWDAKNVQELCYNLSITLHFAKKKKN